MAEETQSRSAQGSKIGTVRVDIARKEKKTFEAVYKTEDKSFQFLIDEPRVRGGNSLGPTPLGYFVSGAASCLTMQYATVIEEQSLPVEGLKILARGHNDRERRTFTDFIYEVNLTGSISASDAEALAREASKRCFVENTLAQAIPVTTEVKLNGVKVTTLSRKP